MCLSLLPKMNEKLSAKLTQIDCGQCFINFCERYLLNPLAFNVPSLCSDMYEAEPIFR